MNQLTDKLNAEIRNFTLIQFLVFMAGTIATMCLYPARNFLAGELLPLVTLGVTGLCDFFIHRNGEYVRGGNYFTGDHDGTIAMKQYENDKKKHWTTMLMVPGAMIMILPIMAGISYFSYRQNSFADSSSWRVWIYWPLAVVSLLMFLGGAQLGRIGWGFKK